MTIPYNKVLVVTAGHVGNTIFCTPAIHLLKKHYPELQIDAVAMHQRAANVLINNPDIHQIFVRNSRWRLKRLMRQYPLTLFLNHVTYSDYFHELPPQCLAIGPTNPDKHRAVEILEFIQQLLQCSLSSTDYRYILQPFPQDIQKIQQQLPKKNHPLVGIHLGNARTQIHGWKFWYKNRTQDRRLWPLDHYITLAQQLRQINPEIQFVITGDKSEKFLGDTFIKNIPHTQNYIGQTTISELAALMKQLDLFITHDTGVLHVANAMRTPLIGLFASTDPMRTGPYPLENHHVILKKERMIDITPKDVCAAFLNYFTRSSASPRTIDSPKPSQLQQTG